MTRFGLRLPNHEARLVALAVSYHLARPGSELDPDTLSEYDHGLAELLPVLEPQIGGAHAVIEITPLQATLLSTAMSSVTSELKMFSLFDTMSGESERPRSTAPGFDARLMQLFPDVSADPSAASDLAEDMTLLRRELPLDRAKELLEEKRKAREEAERARKRWWQFWRRQ
jgi:hypothetical protein